MELRIKNARTTKDVDLAYKDLSLSSKNTEKQKESLLEVLREQISTKNPQEFFYFEIRNAIRDLEGGLYGGYLYGGYLYGGYRFPVHVKVNNITFERFHLDVAIGDTLINPLEFLS